jgi:predicted MFS family arabinose efflux permease
MPSGDIQVIYNPKESFNALLKLFKDPKITKMHGLFINTATTSSFSSGILVSFFCLILNNEPIQEQLRLSSLVMVVYGIGSMCGGQIMGQINDRCGGSLSVSRASLFLHVVTYGLLYLCNEAHSFNTLCFVAGFCSGASESISMTQLSILISVYFDLFAEPFAILTIVKTLAMSIYMILGSHVVT